MPRKAKSPYPIELRRLMALTGSRSLVAFSEASGVNLETARTWASRKKIPLASLYELAHKYKVSVDELVRPEQVHVEPDAAAPKAVEMTYGRTQVEPPPQVHEPAKSWAKPSDLPPAEAARWAQSVVAQASAKQAQVNALRQDNYARLLALAAGCDDQQFGLLLGIADSCHRASHYRLIFPVNPVDEGGTK